MIKIRVNNQEIYIKKDTSIQMEVNSTIFSVDEIPGEIIYTFEVPAQQNDKVFNYARFVYVKKVKKFEAELLIGGIQIAKGDLYIQKATKATYSIGLVVNTFPSGWLEKMLNESNYGEIEISKNTTEHKAKWLEFLKNSLKPDANIKFPLFIDENFYGGKNPDFGFYKGKQASIQGVITFTDIPFEKHFVNRLFAKTGNDVVESQSAAPGVRVFNKFFPEVPENSFAFAPAFNLFYFIMLFFKNLDINVIGNFFDNNKLKKIYFQSLRALDGTEKQNINLGVTFKTKNTDELTPYMPDDVLPPDKLFRTVVEYQNQKMQFFTSQKTGLFSLEIEINLVLPKGYFEKINLFGNTYTPILLMFILDEDNENPCLISNDTTNIAYYNGGVIGYYERFLAWSFDENTMKQKYGYNGNVDNIIKINIQTLIQFENNKGRRFYIGRYLIGKTYQDDYNYLAQEISAFSNFFPDINHNFHNTFSNKLTIAEHTPNLSNGDFIKAIKNCFGLSFYIDMQSKQIEFSHIKDVFSSGYIQLDKYLLNDETFLLENEEKQFAYKLSPVNDEDIDSARLISEVESIKDLSDAKNNFGKIAFVRNQNKYVESVKVGDPELNWKYIYQKYSGNNKELVVGDGETEEISPSVLIPNMKDIDSEAGATDVILEIDKTGVSPLISTGTTDFELLLINCTGLKEISKNKGTYYDYATLVDSNPNKYDLCVTGPNSIGENFIKPWLELFNHEPVTHKFLFNLKTFLEVWKLFKPQHKPVEQQTRWVMVGSIKLLPKKITFQFTEGKEYILAEIEFAKPKVEI